MAYKISSLICLGLVYKSTLLSYSDFKDEGQNLVCTAATFLKYESLYSGKSANHKKDSS